MVAVEEVEVVVFEVEEEVILVEETIVEVVVIFEVEEEWIEAAEGDLGEDLGEVVQEAEVLEIVGAEVVDVVVVVHQKEVVDLQVQVDLQKDQDLISHLLNLQMVMRHNHQVKVDMEEVLAMLMVEDNNNHNSNSLWDMVAVMDHKIILNRHIKVMKVISNLQIMVKQLDIHHQQLLIVGMVEHLLYQLQELSVLVILTVMAKHHHQITRVKMVYMENKIMVAVLVTKTPSLSDVIKLHMQLFNSKYLDNISFFQI